MSGQKVLIIGGGVAGTTLAKELSKGKQPASITLVEPKEYFEVPFAQLRGLTDPKGFAQEIRKPLVDLLPDVNIVQGRASGFDEQAVTLENGTSIPYDWLVLATGSSFGQWPFLNGNETTISERMSSFHKYGRELSDAKSILIIGGGPVGVELAGEIKSKWPEKDLVLIQGGDRLLDQLSEKMSQRAESVLAEMGVQVETGKMLLRDANNTWKDSSGKNYNADLVIPAVGIDLNTDWISEVEKTERGALIVDLDLRLKNFKNVFAIGDINDVPEIKIGALAVQQAKLTAKNLQRLITDYDTELKSYKPSSPVSLVTLGWKKGAVQIPFGHPHFLAFLKQKDLLVSNYLK